MRINNPTDREFLSERTGYRLTCQTFGEGPCVVGFQNFNGIGIEILFATDKPLTRGFIAKALTYPFAQLGVKRVWAQVPVSNTGCKKLSERVGFVCEGLMRDAAKDGDAYLYAMTLPEYGRLMHRLLKRVLGNEQKQSEAACAS